MSVCRCGPTALPHVLCAAVEAADNGLLSFHPSATRQPPPLPKRFHILFISMKKSVLTPQHQAHHRMLKKHARVPRLRQVPRKRRCAHTTTHPTPAESSHARADSSDPAPPRAATRSTAYSQLITSPSGT